MSKQEGIKCPACQDEVYPDPLRLYKTLYCRCGYCWVEQGERGIVFSYGEDGRALHGAPTIVEKTVLPDYEGILWTGYDTTSV